MQYQMSGAPAALPSPVPAARPQPVPDVTRPEPAGPRWGRWIAVLLLLLIAAGAVWWYLQRAETGTQQARTGAAAVRTTTVVKSDFARTLRLTGTTGAQNFVALIAPQLRGRGDGRREGRSFQSGQNTTGAVQSNAGRASSSSGLASSSASGASSGQVSSTMGQSTSGGSSAFRSATSRINRGSTSGSSSRSGSSSSGGASSSGAATGSSSGGDLGSTSGSLGRGMGGGGGGGGGGISDFTIVLQKMARSGSRVRKGDIVAEFDRQFMLLRVDDFKAAVTQTEASFKKLEAELEVGRKAHEQQIAAAKADLDKAQLDLKTTPVLSAIEAERVRLAVEEAQARYKQLLNERRFVEIGMQSQRRNAQIDLEQSRIDLRRAEANADRMVMRAPIDGLVVVQNTFRGSEFQQIQEGDQLWSGMMFMQIVDPSSMVINANVNQVDVERLRMGAKARVRFDAYPDLHLPAHVVSIGAITRTGGSRASFLKEIPVRLKFDNLDPRVIPDLSVSVDVVVEEEPGAIQTSLASVFSDDGGRTFYAFVREGERWNRRVLELGPRNFVSVVVRSGLKPGEVVAAERPPDGKSG